MAATDRKWRRALAAALRLGLARTGVVGVDYGFVYEKGVRHGTLGVRFHVTTKLPPGMLAAHELLPRAIGPIRCDVVEARYAPQGSPRQPCDPLQPGVSIGNLTRGRTGTLGAVVRDDLSGRLGLLSNWHVLCGSNAAQAGDAVSQPGPHHAGTGPVRAVATLERWLALDLGADAALALLGDGVAADAKLFDHTATIAGIGTPEHGMKLVKYGAVSGLTHGVVDGIGGSYQVDYSAYGDEKRWMDGIRIVVDPDHPEAEISLAGDSGAIWLEPATGRAIALHFAGEDGLGPVAEYSLAHPLPRVLELLDAVVP